ncbi:MAG TPA: hypothetical protein VJM15_02555 [Sphingomicrobium sp.]|nr:hypothetical protein [Sphingomicrobium sp.]
MSSFWDYVGTFWSDSDTFWNYFRPLFGGGLLIGTITGLVGFRARIIRPRDRVAGDVLRIVHRDRRRWITLAAGSVTLCVGIALWHGPLGAAERLARAIEADARATAVAWEVPQIRAQLDRRPLTRRLILSGPADDFQRSELVRTMETLPGVSRAAWSAKPAGPPLLLEGTLAALLGFLIGLGLAYLVELRRRYNAQWNW